MVASLRSHNAVLESMQRGCEALVANFVVMSEQQKSVLETVSQMENRIVRHTEQLLTLDARANQSDVQIAELWKNMEKRETRRVCLESLGLWFFRKQDETISSY